MVTADPRYVDKPDLRQRFVLPGIVALALGSAVIASSLAHDAATNTSRAQVNRTAAAIAAFEDLALPNGQAIEKSWP